MLDDSNKLFECVHAGDNDQFDSLNHIDSILGESMYLYKFLSAQHKTVVLNFVENFYIGKTVYFHPAIQEKRNIILAVTAANAALVGAAQQTNYFSSVKWIYFCSDDLSVAGAALMSSTVYLDAEACLKESKELVVGRNLIVHEFAHILDYMYGISGSTKGLKECFNKYKEDLCSGIMTPIEDTEELLISHVEFFARATEAFFTNAASLKAYHIHLYQDLVAIYGLDLADLNYSV